MQIIEPDRSGFVRAAPKFPPPIAIAPRGGGSRSDFASDRTENFSVSSIRGCSSSSSSIVACQSRRTARGKKFFSHVRQKLAGAAHTHTHTHTHTHARAHNLSARLPEKKTKTANRLRRGAATTTVPGRRAEPPISTRSKARSGRENVAVDLGGREEEKKNVCHSSGDEGPLRRDVTPHFCSSPRLRSKTAMAARNRRSRARNL